MNLFLLCFFATVSCFEAGGSVLPSEAYSYLPQASKSQDVSLLKPGHVAYADAMEFARFLGDKGINVKSVHGSKLESFFRGVEKAAFFRTDKGVVEVIFFPSSTGAESVQVTEQRKNGRYLYSFRGQPRPNPPGDTIDAGRPMFFLMRRNWFIVRSSKELYDALQRALTEG